MNAETSPATGNAYPAGISAQELSQVPLAREREVRYWLELHADENYLVSEDCSTIYTDRPQGRNTRALVQVVQRVRKESPHVVFVDEATFSTLQDLCNDGETLEIIEGRTDTVRSLEKILGDAIAAAASDVHLRIRRQNTQVMYRIHDMLSTYQVYSRAVGLRLARTAFNYFARTCADFNEKLPMDGAFDFWFAQQCYGVRMNLMPEVRGCTLVFRLRAPHRMVSCADAGYNPQQCTAIRNGMAHGSGLMIFSGPTNSGKSTTMSNLLATVPSERSVISIEDPVELQLPHVSHVDLSTQLAEVGLQELLACTVRQDPDLLALAEIRDGKTARYAENMALQGRFVISTLHADNVCSIALRLVKLGMDEENLQAPGFLNLLAAQSLAPLLCRHCCTREAPDPDNGRRYRELLGDARGLIRYRYAEGCAHCRSGISGRSLVAEVVPVNREVRSLIRARDYDGIRDYMHRNGIMSRHQHAREKILCGRLDPESVEMRIGLFSTENLP